MLGWDPASSCLKKLRLLLIEPEDEGEVACACVSVGVTTEATELPPDVRFAGVVCEESCGEPPAVRRGADLVAGPSGVGVGDTEATAGMGGEDSAATGSLGFGAAGGGDGL